MTFRRALAIQIDGKNVFVGTSRPAGAADFEVVRYNADGSLDRTFGGDGLVVIDLSYRSDWIRDLAIQADDRIWPSTSLLGSWYSPYGSTPRRLS